MKKTIAVTALAALLAGGSAWASGYRIPEQSVDSTAKAGANIASASSADASYFNPANMAWMAADKWQVEGDLTYIHLPSITYTDNGPAAYNGESEKENFLLPTVFMVSPDYHNFRFGFSVTAPYGLAKRWEQPYPQTFAQEYSLEVFDINPTLAYKLCDYFSIAAGPRLLYSSAQVVSNGVVSLSPLATAARHMEGDTTELGWNVALSARPTKNMTLAATYRSEVDLDLEGDARLSTSASPTVVNTGGNVTVPAPAVLALSGAYTVDKLTVELTWERTFWSEYENIAFQYDTALTGILYGAFGRPVAKNWDDSDSYRLGLSYALNDLWTLMAGFGYDKNPIPESTLLFDLPDSDAYLYSLGARYRVSKQMEVGVGYLYDDKKSRSVTNTRVDGTFTDSSAHLVTVGLTYSF